MRWIDFGIIALSQITITTVLGFWFKNYLPAYFRRKGENLAQKEDLKELTSIVKAVESNFNRDFEKFKSEVDINKSQQIKQFEEEKRALIEFHSAVNEWIFKIFSLNLWEINRLHHLEMKNIITTINNFHSVSLKLSNVRIIVQNDELIDTCRNFLREANEYKSKVVSELTNMQLTNHAIEQRMALISEEEDIEEYTNAVKHYKDLNTENTKKLNDRITEY